jgi:glycosyltransferase involved in cell wall biosynthesis
MQKKQYSVLVVGTSSPHVANYLNRIDADDFIITVISNNDAFLKEGTSFFKVDFSLMKIWNWLITPMKISRVIRTVKPDVIHIHQANAVAFYTVLANKKFKVPTILTAWGSDILINPQKSWILKKMVQYVLKRVNRCTADAHFLAQEMINLVPGYSLKVDIGNFGVPEWPIIDSKEKWFYSNRNHNPLYRIDEVIKGFHRFLSSTDDKSWKLIIAGRGSETQRLLELVDEFKIGENVEFKGFVDTQTNIELYAKAQYFISLPESDATAMSLLESMYFKCIPIVSDLPANQEWIEHGLNGIIVSDLNQNYLTTALSMNASIVGELNHKKILEKGTEKRSKAFFRGVLFKAIES